MPNDKELGLYKKFVVYRADGSRKHHNCQYFVIDITHDPFARAALLAYAAACESEYPKLAADLRKQAE